MIKARPLGRTRFDIAIRNAIMAHRFSAEPSMPMPAELVSTSIPESPKATAREKQDKSPQSAKRALKRAILLCLAPLKPGARVLRAFLIAPLEVQIAHLHTRVNALSGELQAVQQALQADVHAVLQGVHAVQQGVHAVQQGLQGKVQSVQDAATTLLSLVQDLSTAQASRGLDLSTQIGSSLVSLQSLQEQVHDVALRTRGAMLVDDCTFALRTIDGFVFVPRRDSLLLLMLLDAGPEGLEPGTRRVLSKLLIPGMTFVDVGAHIGLLTLAGARAVGPGGKVIAVEPVPLSFELLRRSVSLNGLSGRVDGRCIAVGAQSGRSKFRVRDVLGHSSLVQGQVAADGAEIEVNVTTLDDLIPTGARVDVVKIDVEGAELAVLKGMARVIAENPEVSIIAEFGPSHLRMTDVEPEEWVLTFKNCGFEPFVIDELSGECLPGKLSELREVESVNILFSRYGSAALARVLQ